MLVFVELPRLEKPMPHPLPLRDKYQVHRSEARRTNLQSHYKPLMYISLRPLILIVPYPAIVRLDRRGHPTHHRQQSTVIRTVGQRPRVK
jgi:hypothetical protein